MKQSQEHSFEGPDAIEQALVLLGRTLESLDAAPVELVVIGGAALNVLGLGFRPTKDVDVVGIAGVGDTLCVSARPLPEILTTAAESVAVALGLPLDWLNPGPTDLLQCGLPVGFESRVVRREYGSRLTVLFAGRLDLIAFKTYAAADGGPQSRHTTDLLALSPTSQELSWAAEWVRQHDASAAFGSDLDSLVSYVSRRTTIGGPDA